MRNPLTEVCESRVTELVKTVTLVVRAGFQGLCNVSGIDVFKSPGLAFDLSVNIGR